MKFDDLMDKLEETSDVIFGIVQIILGFAIIVLVLWGVKALIFG